ncbi:MAG TPA: tetratricopeptide repeat protein [Candidatus Binatia bacterium]|jgi:tetratricopeptide (TPR) repeat protein|nr:tetratricopeptide repeat protein [Candidatus Binatia bacterium]
MNGPSNSSPDSRGPADRWVFLFAHPISLCLLLVALTLAVYWPVREFDFINLDDQEYVVSNPRVQGGLTWDDIAWGFTTSYASNWHPVTWCSHMLDAEFFGTGAAGPHVVNLAFHTANAVLLFLFLRARTGAQWRSALVAAVFALHPLHVESVAWISERKDVLSTFFGLLALGAYGKYASANPPMAGPPCDRVSSSLPPQFWYVCALVLFMLGLMAKPMLVTLPFVMLLLDYWPLQRIRAGGRPAFTIGRLVFEKLPFFGLSAASCVITFLVQKQAGAVDALALSPGDRIANAFVSYARYMGKAVWPGKLALPYPHPGHWPVVTVLFSLAVVTGVCAVAYWLGRKRRFLITGWFWFLGTLVPAIGLVQVGTQSLADRYTYVPLVGLFVALVWSAAELMRYGKLSRIAASALGIVLLGICAVRTATQLSYWRNSEILFRHSIALTQNNSAAYESLGSYLYTHGHTDEAVEAFQKAVQINPKAEQAYASLGRHFYLKGHLEEAMDNYRKAIQFRPRSPYAWDGVGSVFARQRQFPQAIQAYETALRLNPDYVQARNDLAVVLDAVGRTDEAIHQYNEALRLDPTSAQAHNNLANILLVNGKVDEAVTHYRRALTINPNSTDALNNLGLVLADRKQYSEALACYGRAAELAPRDAQPRCKLGDVLTETGHVADALGQYTEAVRLQPDCAEAHYGLGASLARLGRREEALPQLAEAVRLKPGYAEARRYLEQLQPADPTPK